MDGHVSERAHTVNLNAINSTKSYEFITIVTLPLDSAFTDIYLSLGYHFLLKMKSEINVQPVDDCLFI